MTVLSRPDDEPAGAGALLVAGLLVIGCSGGGDGDDGGDAAAGEAPQLGAGPVARVRDRRPRRGPDGRDHRVTGDRADLPPVPPSGYDGETPTALVLNIHGLGSNGDQQASFTGMEDLAEDEGFIAIHPNGEGELPLWNYVSDNRASNDIGFISELVDALERLCIDTTSTPPACPTAGSCRRRWCASPDQIAAASAVRGWPSWTGARTARRCRP